MSFDFDTNALWFYGAALAAVIALTSALRYGVLQRSGPIRDEDVAFESGIVYAGLHGVVFSIGGVLAVIVGGLPFVGSLVVSGVFTLLFFLGTWGYTKDGRT